MPNITNLHYDKKHQQLGIKKFGEKKIEFVPFQRIIYAKKGMIPADPVGHYYIKETNKKFYFTEEPVDEIKCMTDGAYYELMGNKKYPRENMYLTDLRPEYQYLLYNNKQLSDKYVKGYLDIETDDDINSELAQSPILMITIMIDGNIKVFNIHDFVSEETMMESFFKWICDEAFPDVLLGWNVVDFDLKYIVNRADRLGVKYDFFKFRMIEFINMADILKKKFGYSILKDTGGMSLEAVATYFLGAGKKKMPTTFGKYFKQDMEGAVEYNLTDVVILEELDNKVLFFDFLVKIQDVSGVLVRDAFYNSIIIDVMIIKRYANYVFPSRKTQNEIVDEEEYEGGHVISPPKGIFSNVALFDYASQYPSIILTFNISPDSKRSEGADYKIDDVGFVAKPYGIFKKTIGELFEHRLALKTELKKLEKKGKETIEYKNADTLQGAYKTILNSFYGVCAFRGFRFYDVDLAKSITFMGRTLLLMLKDEVEKNKLGIVVAGDSVENDTNVILNNKERTIEDAFLYLDGEFRTEGEKEYKIFKPNDIYTPVPDGDKTIEKSVNYICRHVVSKPRYKITLENGKSVKVTSDHSLVVVRDGKEIVIKPDQLLDTDIFKFIDYDEETKYVKCKLCNKYFKAITRSHLRLHNLSQKKYEKLFPNASVASRSTRYGLDTASLKAHIRRYGEVDGKRKYKKLAKFQSDKNKFSYKKKKYGWSKKEFKSFNSSRSITKENLIRRHGEKLGIALWKTYTKRQSVAGNALEYFVNKYGEEGFKKYQEVCKSKAVHRICSNPSKIELKFVKDVVKILPKNFVHYSSLSKSFGTFDKSKNRAYTYDFVLTKPYKVCIEFHGDLWHGNPKFYKPTDIHKITKMSYTSVKQYDNEKQQCIEKYGFKYYYVWENDYRKKPEEVMKKVKQWLKLNT